MKKGKKRKAGKEKKRKKQARKEKRMKRMVLVSEKLEFTPQVCHLLVISLDLSLIIYKMEIRLNYMKLLIFGLS